MPSWHYKKRKNSPKKCKINLTKCKVYFTFENKEKLKNVRVEMNKLRYFSGKGLLTVLAK